MSGSGTLRDLHSGVLHKVGGRVKTWHKRWMIIRSDYSLYYFKDPNKAPQGSIPLRDTNFSVREGVKTDTSWPKSCALENTLVLTTSTRTYYMFAESLKEAKEWKLQLEKAVERMKEEEGGFKGRRSIRKVSEQAGSGTCSAQAAKLQRPEAVEVNSKHTPKMYQKKDRRMPTKRFQAKVDDLGSGSSDTDSEELKLADGGLDGELDATEYDPVPTSPLDDDQHESLYDLAGTSENDVVSPLNNNSSPLPRDARLSQASSSTDVHESLYDLVAMINADENTSETTTTTTTTTPSKPPVVPQDTYEEMGSPPPQDETYEAIDAPPPSPSLLSQSVKTLPLPSIPPPSTTASSSNAQSDIYEELDTPADSNLYEDIDKSGRVEEAVSDEEGDIPVRTPAPGPPVPSRDPGPPLPPKDSSPPPIIPPRSAPAPEQQNNAPTLPPKPEDTPTSPYRAPPEAPANSSSGEASDSPKKTADGREPALAAPADEQEGEDIYDDTLAVTKPPEQVHSQDNSQQEEEGEVYDDIEGVMQQNIVRTDSKEKEEDRKEPEVEISASPPENHVSEEPAIVVNGTEHSSPPPPNQTRPGDGNSPRSERMSEGMSMT